MLFDRFPLMSKNLRRALGELIPGLLERQIKKRILRHDEAGR